MGRPTVTGRLRTCLAASLVSALACGLAPAAARAADPASAVLDLTRAAAPVPVPPERRAAQARLRRTLGARALVQADPVTGTPRVVARLDGALTGPSPEDPAAIVLAYVRAREVAFGLDADDLAELRLTARTIGADGTVHLSWEQRKDGLPLVDGGLEAAVAAGGRLLNVRGGAVPDPAPAGTEPRVGAAAAAAAALPGAGPAPGVTAAGGGAERRTELEGGGRASLVLYADGAAERLGWRVLAPAGSAAFYDALVDARSGRLVRRVNRVRSASARHVDVTTRGEGTVQSPFGAGWLGGGSGLSGPYAHAVSDLEDRIRPEATATGFTLSAQPDSDDEVSPSAGSGSGRTWTDAPRLDFCGAAACSWSPADRTANRRFSTTQLFWYVNTFRDHLAAAPIGFTAARGGFEGDDAVLAQSLDGAATGPDAAHRSNANMLTLPDGFPGLMQMYLFGAPFGSYDGAHDAGVVYHEYAHGLTDRLITDSQGFGTLDGAQPGALSEGLSDFYALDFLAATEPLLVPDGATAGEVRLGQRLQQNPAARGLSAFRTEGLDCPPGGGGSGCPGTPGAGPGGYDYADFGRIAGAPEIHADGELWAQTLWSVRTALIAAHGPGEGIARARAYVTEGLRLAPDAPSFLDLRNAIVQAAVAARGNQDWELLWRAFAARGMGWTASTAGPDDVAPVAGYDVPPPPGSGERGSVAGTLADETGAPVGDAVVAVAGHETGLGATDLRTASGDDGRYALAGVPAGRYPDVHVTRPGFQETFTALDVVPGAETPWNVAPLWRDHASLAGGGGVAGFTPPDYSADGCGPNQAIDDDKGTVWSTLAGAGPRDLAIDLGGTFDLREVRIDPRAGCGDAPGASLAVYELAASDGLGRPYETISSGTLGAPDARGYVRLALAGDLGGRRLLRLRAISPRSLNQGGTAFMDVAELEVTGAPPAPPPRPPPPTGGGTLPGRAIAPATLRDRRVKVDRRGRFRIRVAFAADAPRGVARLRVLGRRNRLLAAAKVRVRRGRTVSVPMRLTASGRRAVGRGRVVKVKLRLRMPGGMVLGRTVKLARRR